MTETDKKSQSCRVAFLSRSAPYGKNRANLCLDIALAAAVFEQDVSYIFLDDGVFQILKGQDASAIESKTLGNALETLALYGIEKVYVDRKSLELRGIDESHLLPGIEILDGDALAESLHNAKAVFNL